MIVEILQMSDYYRILFEMIRNSNVWNFLMNFQYILYDSWLLWNTNCVIKIEIYENFQVYQD